MEHGTSTTLLHLARLWNVFSSLAEVEPPFLSSNSAPRLQLFRSRPLFLFHCEFQGRAWRVLLLVVLLMVCPVHLHAGSVWRLVPVLLFAIAPHCLSLSCHLILKIHLGQVLINIVIFCIIRVVLQVSVEPGRLSNVGIDDAKFCGDADLL